MTTRYEVIHIRRCHVCGTVNEQVNNELEKCHQCDRTLAPFFYFHPTDIPTESADALDPSKNLDILKKRMKHLFEHRPESFSSSHRWREESAELLGPEYISVSLPQGSPYRPLRGVSAVWTTEGED